MTTCWPIRNTWILWTEGLAEGRTYVAAEDGSLVGFATWIEADGTIESEDGTIELEDLFVHPGWMRRGIATALVNRFAGVLRAKGRAAPGSDRQPARAGFL